MTTARPQYPAGYRRRAPFLAVLAVLAVALLGGCRLAAPSASTAATGDNGRGRGQEVRTVNGIALTAPYGFCLDRAASSDVPGSEALIVLSSCQGLRGGLFTPRPRHPAVLTLAIAPPGPTLAAGEMAPQLAAYLASTRGRALLSRTGMAETVSITESFAEGPALVMRLRDTAPFAWGAVQAEYWRALLPLGGRMVTAAVLGPADRPLGRDEGLALLHDFTAGLRPLAAATGITGAKGD